MNLRHAHRAVALSVGTSHAEWPIDRRQCSEESPGGMSGRIMLVAMAVLLLAINIGLRLDLFHRHDEVATTREELRLLPRGEWLKPLVLGYHHVAADVLWLKIVQVLGEREVRQAEYEWLFHALDVGTTLDPRYTYAYDVGGVVLAELAGRVDWSNALLEKGVASNPEAWRLPFQLGFNAFFHQREYVRAAHYMAVAARLPGRPAYVPELAARLYVEGKQPALALHFLDVMLQQTQDEQVLAVLERRRAEVLLEQDLDALNLAVKRYTDRTGRPPDTLVTLVQSGDVPAIPSEPFGGAYRLDEERGAIVSTTHPDRMRLHHAPDGSLASLR